MKTGQTIENEATAQPLRSGGLVGLLRRLQCKAGLCAGHVEHERDADGKWWIGLRCTATGTLHGRTLSRFQDKQPNTKEEVTAPRSQSSEASR